MKHIFQYTERERAILEEISSRLFQIIRHYDGKPEVINHLANMLYPALEIIDESIMISDRAIDTMED